MTATNSLALAGVYATQYAAAAAGASTGSAHTLTSHQNNDEKHGITATTTTTTHLPHITLPVGGPVAASMHLEMNHHRVESDKSLLARRSAPVGHLRKNLTTSSLFKLKSHFQQ